jgi:DNA-binding transcriptional ArsR family regulator
MDDGTYQGLDPDVRRLARFTVDGQRGNYVRLDEAVEGVMGALLSDPVSVEAQTALGLPSADQVTAADAAAGLRLLPAQRSRLDSDERTLIEAALDRGMTWEQLGQAIGGRSRQAMQQHYRALGGARTWPTRRPATSPAATTTKDN